MFRRILHGIINQNQDQLPNFLFIRIQFRLLWENLLNDDILLLSKRPHNANRLLCSGNQIHPHRFDLIGTAVRTCNCEEITDQLGHLFNLITHILNNLLQKRRCNRGIAP